MSFSHFSNNKNTATNTTGTFGSDLIQSIQSCGKNAIDEQDRAVAVETAVSILMRSGIVSVAIDWPAKAPRPSQAVH